MELTTTSQVEGTKSTTTSQVECTHIVEKSKKIRCNPKFPCKLCKETTLLNYALAFPRCKECGPNLKDLLVLTHSCLLNIPCLQPLQFMLETCRQLVKIRLEATKEKLNSLEIYAREITLLNFVLM